jgi:hypothetical protein
MNIEATPAACAGQVWSRCQRRRTCLIAGPKSLTSARCLRFCCAESRVRPNGLRAQLPRATDAENAADEVRGGRGASAPG